MLNWDNVFRIWTVFFAAIAAIGIVMFYAPLFGKKILALEDYALRGGAVVTFLGVGGSKLCLVFGWPSGWQHVVLAAGALSSAFGVLVLIIKYRHSKGTAALQEYMYQKEKPR